MRRGFFLSRKCRVITVLISYFFQIISLLTDKIRMTFAKMIFILHCILRINKDSLIIYVNLSL
jgi:hypothetical protein